MGGYLALTAYASAISIYNNTGVLSAIWQRRIVHGAGAMAVPLRCAHLHVVADVDLADTSKDPGPNAPPRPTGPPPQTMRTTRSLPLKLAHRSVVSKSDLIPPDAAEARVSSRPYEYCVH